MVISLFLIFLKLFAWDAVKRFNREEVMVRVDREVAESLDTPAVTICVDLVSKLLLIPLDTGLIQKYNRIVRVDLTCRNSSSNKATNESGTRTGL